MTFEVVSKKGSVICSLQKSMECLCNLGCILAQNAHETAIDISMMLLRKGESLTLHDADGKEIKVTRLS
ncbi:hypothetical protein LLR47_17415 [Bacillus cereus]|uniref:hypothetical protein n=1 Tax=Bacillus cereus TaxID=1396 RepID=UPI001D14A389|nr:hypothetical protein [Bacillus cereus]MCC3687009.1 hypothetical protein [Bacillus cereus]